MNESFKNSLKGFKVKGILILVEAFFIIATCCAAFNSGNNFYVVCGVVVLLSYVVLVIKAILDNKAKNEAAANAQKLSQQYECEKRAAENTIAKLKAERDEAISAKAKAEATAKAATKAADNKKK